MNIFNSLGSNYNLKIALEVFFAVGSKKDRDDLINILNTKFDGETHLFYKGRQAIESALKISGISKGSVVINSFTCNVVKQAVEQAGLKSLCLETRFSERMYLREGTAVYIVTFASPKFRRALLLLMCTASHI